MGLSPTQDVGDSSGGQGHGVLQPPPDRGTQFRDPLGAALPDSSSQGEHQQIAPSHELIRRPMFGAPLDDDGTRTGCVVVRPVVERADEQVGVTPSRDPAESITTNSGHPLRGRDTVLGVGPTGYGLARLLASMGIDCQVVAPSLIPTELEEAVRDLCRVRVDAVQERRRAASAWVGSAGRNRRM